MSHAPCHHESILMALGKVVIACLTADVLKSHRLIQPDSREIRGPHVQNNGMDLVIAGQPEQMGEQGTSQAASSPGRSNA